MSGHRQARALRGGVVPTVGLVALVVLVNGAAASASTAGVPKAMAGCWHRHAPALPVGTSAGVWLIKLTTSGELLAYTPGTTSCNQEPDFTGRISVAGSRLTIGQLPVCPTKGAYTWKASKRVLTLKATKDSCSSRKLLFTGTWAKI